jgi:hypothetical protein
MRVARAVPRIMIALWPSRVVPIAMIGAVTRVVAIVVSFTLVLGLGCRTRATPEREPVVIVIPIALAPIAVAWVALVTVVAWIKVHGTSAEQNVAVLPSDTGLRRMCA